MTQQQPLHPTARLFVLVCALLIIAAAGPAAAYNTYGSSWADNSTDYSVLKYHTPVLVPVPIGSETITAVYRAAAKWNAVPASDYALAITETNSEEFSYGPHPGGSNHNDGWNTVGFDYEDVGGPPVIIYMISTTAGITEADIVFNLQRCLSAVSSTGCYEVEPLALYAFGVAAGLTHSYESDAIMTVTYTRSTDTTYPITLTNDDMQGLVSIYPRRYTAAGSDVRSTPGLAAGDMNAAVTTVTYTAAPIADQPLDAGSGEITVQLDGRDDLVYVDTKGYVYYTADLKNWDKIGANKFTDIAAGDVDSDGYDDDLAGINLNSFMLYTTDKSNWTKIGSNKFSKLAFADIGNIDGYRDDLAGINLNQYILYSSDTTNWNKIGSNKFSSLLSGDVDGDGYTDDLAGINLNQYMLYTTDTGNWNKIGANKFTKMAYFDYDKDGKNDEIIGLNLNQYILYSSDTTNWNKIGSNKFSAMAVGDLDRDGYADDIAAINVNRYLLYTTDNTNWTKIGTNQFNSLTVLDLDDDGYEDDIAAVNQNNHVMYTTDLNSWTQITKP